MRKSLQITDEEKQKLQELVNDVTLSPFANQKASAILLFFLGLKHPDIEKTIGVRRGTLNNWLTACRKFGVLNFVNRNRSGRSRIPLNDMEKTLSDKDKQLFHHIQNIYKGKKESK